MLDEPTGTQVSIQPSNFVPPSNRYAEHTLIRQVPCIFTKQLHTLLVVTDGIHNVYTLNFFPPYSLPLSFLPLPP